MKRNQATQGKTVLTVASASFAKLTDFYGEVTACVQQAEQVKGRWLSMAQGIVTFCGSDRGKLVAIVGDGDGVAEAKELKLAVIAGLPTLSRTLLETERADTAKENVDARDAAQANVATYIRRIRQSVFDILDGKAAKGERTAPEKVEAAIAAGERFVKALGKCEGEFSLHKVTLSYLVDSLAKGSNLKANIIGMAAMIAANEKK